MLILVFDSVMNRVQRVGTARLPRSNVHILAVEFVKDLCPMRQISFYTPGQTSIPNPKVHILIPKIPLPSRVLSL